SPLPNAIIQKVNDSAQLHLLFTSQDSKKLGLSLFDSVGKRISGFTSFVFSFHNNFLDTTILIPVLRNFTLSFRSERDSGSISNLCVGHIFGIAGQSNAQGWSPPPFVEPHGDIRMLRNDSAWQKGEDP